MTKSANLSDADKTLLRALQRDGRATNAELSAIAHMSESACLRRVKALEQAGVIERYAAIVNPAAAGRPLTVFVTLSLESQAQEALADFERAVMLVPDVQECHLMAGTSDYILRIAVSDVDELERFHSQVLTRLPGVARVVSSLVLRSVVRRSSLPL
ncbi:MAG TPA: Lrp/AsnC family transcriptional regulator [Rhizomicrobium sp.]|nr:Lrp/AsnC family transcriptional regulator [Rhizomicrobium sp.]